MAGNAPDDADLGMTLSSAVGKNSSGGPAAAGCAAGLGPLGAERLAGGTRAGTGLDGALLGITSIIVVGTKSSLERILAASG